MLKPIPASNRNVDTARRAPQRAVGENDAASLRRVLVAAVHPANANRVSLTLNSWSDAQVIKLGRKYAQRYLTTPRGSAVAENSAASASTEKTNSTLSQFRAKKQSVSAGKPRVAENSAASASADDKAASRAKIRAFINKRVTENSAVRARSAAAKITMNSSLQDPAKQQVFASTVGLLRKLI